jgi:glutamate synthase (NADPH/NADH) small chain
MKNEMKSYCLNCLNKPCKEACPLENDVPGFIQAEKIEDALRILYKTTVLPSICGRVCQHSKQCEGNCTRRFTGNPVNIGLTEVELGDYAIKNNIPIPTYVEEDLESFSVAVVGGGPAGLTCAAFLARKGIKVTIFEKREKLGGVLRYGIPDFRLPKDIVDSTIEKILNLGIKTKCNTELGKEISIEDLSKKYDAVFISIGANIHSKANIEGEDGDNVFGANEMLEYNEFPDFTGKKVAVLGGGNVAMDAARTIIRKNPESVTVVYRRSQNEMPAEDLEIESAKSEGIIFLFQTNITKIKKDSIDCIKTELVQKEGDTRPSPVNIEGSDFSLPIDIVVLAVGSKPDTEITKYFQINKRGNIAISEDRKAQIIEDESLDNIFAGGDITGDRATVAWAARSGREASVNIINYLKK